MSFSVRASLEQFTLDHPGGTGRLKISVAAPPMPTDGPTSVVYVPDADLLFGMAAEIARGLSMIAEVPGCYVVGIGYDADYMDFLKLRTADLSPPMDAAGSAALGAMGTMIGSDRNGGADAFLAFLSDTLRTEIATRYPATGGGDQVLFGHSLGGLFAAHALLERPDSFTTFLISSPSLWWDGFSIFKRLSAVGDRFQDLSKQPRVFVDVGGKEQDLPQSVPEGLGATLEEAQAQIVAARMVDAAREFADGLKDAGVRDLRHVAFAEEDHASVASAALVHGMRFALKR